MLNLQKGKLYRIKKIVNSKAKVGQIYYYLLNSSGNYTLGFKPNENEFYMFLGFKCRDQPDVSPFISFQKLYKFYNPNIKSLIYFCGEKPDFFENNINVAEEVI